MSSAIYAKQHKFLRKGATPSPLSSPYFVLLSGRPDTKRSAATRQDNKGTAFSAAAPHNYKAYEMNTKLLALAALASSALAAAAQTYEIHGTAPAEVKTVYLLNYENNVPDSTTVSNGHFTFKGEAGNTPFASVSSELREGTPVYLDGVIEVDLANKTAKGNAETEGLTTWSHRIESVRTHMRDLVKQYNDYRAKGQQVPDTTWQRIDREYDGWKAQQDSLINRCCVENRQRKFPALFLVQTASSMPKEMVIALAEEGDPAYMKVEFMSRLRSSIEGWKRQLPGTPVTDLTLQSTDGQTHKLSEYVGNGKYVLLDFWASWCGPCRREMPNVKALYDKYHAKGFDIVGLSLDSDKKAWADAVDKMGLTWHHLSDLQGWKSVAATTYGINAIPATLLIGPDGKVVASGLDSESLGKKLAELLP